MVFYETQGLSVYGSLGIKGWYLPLHNVTEPLTLFITRLELFNRRVI